LLFNFALVFRRGLGPLHAVLIIQEEEEEEEEEEEPLFLEPQLASSHHFIFVIRTEL
jgi:hypothetical protein